jgi:glycosyltransferase involved in cell wall biosynthesis
VDVLAVAPYVPYEGIPHAGGEYLLRHLRELARAGPVTLLVPGSPDALADRERAPDWLDLIVSPLGLAERTRARVLHDAAYRRLMAAPPMPTAESLRAVRAGGLFARAREADLVELHWPEYARFATELRRAGVRTPVSVVEHDVDVRGAVQRLGTRLHGYRKVLGVLTSPVPRRHELRGLRAADLVLVFKESDAALLREVGVSTRVRVIDPWLEVPEGDDPGRRPWSVLFTGALWRPENDMGARWLVERVWPGVRAQVPAATLVLAGAGPTAELRAAARAAEGVEVTGQVPSLLPHYRQASVFAAPLISGGGLKFKVAQAMLCGLPVVATPVAVEGVVERTPEGVLWRVTADADAFAAALVGALRRPDEAQAVGAAARDWAVEHWSFSRSMAGVLDDYQRLAARAR